ncbi:MAG: hypothetical protein R3F05_04625 [Planctomycetota bacterium]
MKPMPLPASERARMEALSWRSDISLQERLDVPIGWAARVLYPAMIDLCMCPACVSPSGMREVGSAQPTALELRQLAETPADEPTCHTLPHGGFASWRSLADVAGLPWSDALSWEQVRDSAPAGTALRQRLASRSSSACTTNATSDCWGGAALITPGACGIAWMPMDGPLFTWEGTELETLEATVGEVLDLIHANDGYPPNTCWSLDGAWGHRERSDQALRRDRARVGARRHSLEATGLGGFRLRAEDVLP